MHIGEMVVLTDLMRPRQFLLLGGTLLVILGLAGVAGLLGSISQASLFNPPYWINWFHLTFGIVVFAIAFAGGRTLQSAMTLAAGWEHARPLRLAVRVLRREALQHAGACRSVRSLRPSDSWCAGSLGMVKQENRTSAVSA